jgi:hypothetical protein
MACLSLLSFHDSIGQAEACIELSTSKVQSIQKKGERKKKTIFGGPFFFSLFLLDIYRISFSGTLNDIATFCFTSATSWLKPNGI